MMLTYWFIKVQGEWTIGQWNGKVWAVPGRIISPNELEDIGQFIFLPDVDVRANLSKVEKK